MKQNIFPVGLDIDDTQYHGAALVVSTISVIRLATVMGALLLATPALAEPVYQPPGANLTYGNVTHGQRILSTTSNPAAAAADVFRGGGKAASGTVVSLVAGIEYGNVQELFDAIDELTKGFEPTDPDPPPPIGAPTPENPSN